MAQEILTKARQHPENPQISPGDVSTGGALFFSRTPMATFGYGWHQFRIKLRKDVTFVQTDDRSCDGYKNKNVVLVAHDVIQTWVEYLVCSSVPVASWSIDTPESLQEIMAEKKWVQSHDAADFESMLRPGPNNKYSGYYCREADGCGIYGWGGWQNFTTKCFNDDIAHLLSQLKLNSAGEIFYAPDIPHDERAHFATQHPIYFNPVTEN
jgi:hypothetical protein